MFCSSISIYEDRDILEVFVLYGIVSSSAMYIQGNLLSCQLDVKCWFSLASEFES